MKLISKITFYYAISPQVLKDAQQYSCYKSRFKLLYIGSYKNDMALLTYLIKNLTISIRSDKLILLNFFETTLFLYVLKSDSNIEISLD